MAHGWVVEAVGVVGVVDVGVVVGAIGERRRLGVAAGEIANSRGLHPIEFDMQSIRWFLI